MIIEKCDVRELWNQYMRVYGQLLHFASSFHPSFHASFSSLCFLCGLTAALDSQNFFYSLLTDAIDHLYGPECSEAHE